jgi:hypothetical protein
MKQYTAFSQKIKEMTQKEYDQFLLTYLPRHRCASCRSPRFVHHGSYNRHLFFNKQRSTTIQVARVKCTSCRRTQIIRHPCIIAFKRYCLHFLIQLIVLHKQRHSTYWIIKQLNLCRSYINYILRQFRQWHELALEIVAMTLPPPDIHVFSRLYQEQFSYGFMQIVSS